MMKRFYLLLFFASLMTAASAQVKLRPQLGGNSSFLYDDRTDLDLGDRTGYQFGVDVMIGDEFFYQPGLFFERVQQKVLPLEPGIEGGDFSANRLRVPLNIGFKALDIDEPDQAVGLRLFIGLNLGFLLAVRGGDSTLQIDRDDFRDWLVGLQGGAGIDLGHFFLDITYHLGLTNVFSEEFPIESRNNIFYFNAGYRIGL